MMNEKYSKIKHKTEFCLHLSNVLGLKQKTVENYLTSNNIPTSKTVRIDNAIELQISFDEKINEMQKEITNKF